jgi:hypothetical protein
MNGGSTTSSTSSGARRISGKPGINASITPATTSRIAARDLQRPRRQCDHCEHREEGDDELNRVDHESAPWRGC